MPKKEVSAEYLKKHPTLFTVIRIKGGKPKRVALHGDCTIEVPAGAGGPAQKIHVPAPSQSDLEYLFSIKHPAVIEVAEEDKPAKAKSAFAPYGKKEESDESDT